MRPLVVEANRIPLHLSQVYKKMNSPAGIVVPMLVCPHVPDKLHFQRLPDLARAVESRRCLRLPVILNCQVPNPTYPHSRRAHFTRLVLSFFHFIQSGEACTAANADKASCTQLRPALTCKTGGAINRLQYARWGRSGNSRIRNSVRCADAPRSF